MPHNCLSRLELDTQFPSIVAPEDDGLDDMARDIDDPVLQHGRRIARSISDGMFKHGRTRRDNTGGTVAPTVAFCDCVLEHPEVTPPPCAQVAPINAEHAGCVGESNPRSLPSTLAASGSAAREGRPQSTRSTLAALGSATPRTLPSTLAASGCALARWQHHFGSHRAFVFNHVAHRSGSPRAFMFDHDVHQFGSHRAFVFYRVVHRFGSPRAAF